MKKIALGNITTIDLTILLSYLKKHNADELKSEILKELKKREKILSSIISYHEEYERENR
jgi:hypothetical protein